MLLAPVGCRPEAVKVGETPIRIVSEEVGHGREASPGDLAIIDYRIVRPDGQELMREQGFRFVLDGGAVIQGIDDGVRGMREGGTRIYDCPPHLHWGRAAYGEADQVPYNATLRVEVTLKKVET